MRESITTSLHFPLNGSFINLMSYLEITCVLRGLARTTFAPTSGTPHLCHGLHPHSNYEGTNIIIRHTTHHYQL